MGSTLQERYIGSAHLRCVRQYILYELFPLFLEYRQ